MKFMTRLAEELHSARQREAHVAVQPLKEPKKERAKPVYGFRVEQIFGSPFPERREPEPEELLHTLPIRITHENPEALEEFKGAVEEAAREHQEEILQKAALVTAWVEKGKPSVLHIEISHPKKKAVFQWRGQITRVLDQKSRPTP